MTMKRTPQWLLNFYRSYQRDVDFLDFIDSIHAYKNGLADHKAYASSGLLSHRHRQCPNSQASAPRLP
jgi:hypothetical protein